MALVYVYAVRCRTLRLFSPCTLLGKACGDSFMTGNGRSPYIVWSVGNGKCTIDHLDFKVNQIRIS